MDLRERVITAIVGGGVSCREAAKHFGVAASTAITWVQRVRATGSAAPGKIGGYRPRAIAGGHRDWLVERCQTHDFTLLAVRGLKVDYRTVWSFVHAEKLSYKKALRASEQDPPPLTIPSSVRSTEPSVSSARRGPLAGAVAALPGPA